MKRKKHLAGVQFLIFTAALFISNCTTTLSTADIQKNAETAFDDGDYTTALLHYENLIKQWNEGSAFEENPYYDKAGLAAFALQDYSKAIEYFNHSMHYGTAEAETYLKLMNYFREINNFSREMSTLNAIFEKFPEQAEAANVHERLFEMYEETERWEDAAAQAQLITRDPDALLVEKLLRVYNRLGDSRKEEEAALKLLQLQPDNVAALEWQAKKYYDLAEARYKAETEAYERNRTHRQYAQLLRGYEEAGDDYRKARDIYERLYKQNPDRRYAIYLHNIYARFNDEEKAAYYRRRF
jgi:tetratricopeptide (TPR) repeat protein